MDDEVKQYLDGMETRLSARIDAVKFGLGCVFTDRFTGAESRIIGRVNANVAEMEEMESRMTERLGELETRLMAKLAELERSAR